MSTQEFDPVYMDPTLYQAMREWPVTLPEDVWTRIFAARFVTEPFASLPHDWFEHPIHTNLGRFWFNAIQAQSNNFWNLDFVLGVWPIEELANRRQDVAHYLRCFHSTGGVPFDFNSRDVRRYIARGLQGPTLHSLGGKYPADPIRRSLAGFRGLLESLGDLEGALSELVYEHARERNRRFFAENPDEIPF